MEIRPLAGLADYHACVALQHEIWGAGFLDAVPPSVLQVCQRMGGVASGAFEGETLVGFVFGVTGVRHGELAHWSDMLAVRAHARNTGLAMRLKAHQRDQVRAVGARTIYWTFDPLVARNAHLNFNKLAVAAEEYVPNMYGITESALHGGIPTDRLIVSWPVDDQRSRRRAEPVDRSEISIEVPRDFEALVRTDHAEAMRWRLATRAAFVDAMRAGRTVRGFERGDERRAPRYLLARSTS